MATANPTPENVIAMLEERLRKTLKVRVFDRAVLRYNLGLAQSENPTGSRELNLTRAAGSLEQAASLFEQANRPMEQARALNGLGSVLRDLRRSEEAVDAFRKAGEMFPPGINPGEHGAAMNNLGLALIDLGRIDEASDALDQALKDFTGPEFIRQRVTTLLNLGQALSSGPDVSHVARAIERFEEALELADPQEAPYVWAQLYFAMGTAFTAIDAPAKAANAFEQALRVYTRHRWPFQYALTKNNLGLAYAQIGGVSALRKAVAAYEDGLRLLDLRLHREQWEQVYRNLDLAEAALRDLGEDRTRMEHFVLLLGEEEGEALTNRMRERIEEYASTPEPRRTETLAEISAVTLALPDEEARKVTGAWLRVLMELPNELFVAGLSGWMRAYERLDPAGRERASEIIDWTMSNELLAPQRIRVRDSLYEMGWLRQGQDAGEPTDASESGGEYPSEAAAAEAGE
ncbi:MAG: tetratricopeptide repeat protein [Actinomycetota bacterium]